MIVAATVSVKTMADSTLRLTIDIEPNDAQAAFALFGSRGVPCVIARLTQEAATAAQQAATIAGDTDALASNEKPVGGPLARLAGQFCANPEFRQWLSETGEGSLFETAEEAAEEIRVGCGIASRAELDHNPTAAQFFHEMFRKPYADWCRAKVVA